MEFLIFILVVIGGFIKFKKFLPAHVVGDIIVTGISILLLTLCLWGLIMGCLESIDEFVWDNDETRRISSCEMEYNNNDFRALASSITVYNLTENPKYAKYVEFADLYRAYQTADVWRIAASQGTEGADEKLTHYKDKYQQLLSKAQFPENQKKMNKIAQKLMED